MDGGVGAVEPVALMRFPWGTTSIIESTGRCSAAHATPFEARTATFGNFNCELFQVLFRASVNHNGRQTSWTVFRWFTRTLLLAFK
jgi:hypothetical protein